MSADRQDLLRLDWPELTSVVVVDLSWGIGRGGDQLYHLRGDMSHFRRVTSGGTMILGRKTLETFPGGQPLAGRRHVVLTGSPELLEGIDVTPVSRLEDLPGVLAGLPGPYFVVGGSSIYEQLLPVTRFAIVTIIETRDEGVDRWHPNLDEDEEWRQDDCSVGCLDRRTRLSYKFCRYSRIAGGILDRSEKHGRQLTDIT